MAYQDFALAGNMSIQDTIYLGREPGLRFGSLRVVDRDKARAMAQHHLDRLKIRVKPIDRNAESLGSGQRQAVAIARATAFDAQLVVMDESTSGRRSS